MSLVPSALGPDEKIAFGCVEWTRFDVDKAVANRRWRTDDSELTAVKSKASWVPTSHLSAV